MTLSADTWIAKVRDWAADCPQVPRLDVSRDSIYGEIEMDDRSELLRDARERAHSWAPFDDESAVLLRKLADIVEAYDKKAATVQEKPMGKHSKLLKEARKLAGKLCPITGTGKGISFPDGRPGVTVEYVPPSITTAANAAASLEKLADIVEAYDKPAPDPAELLAACKTCDAVIGAFIREYPAREAIDNWAPLRAARKLTQVAVENHEKAQVAA